MSVRHNLILGGCVQGLTKTLSGKCTLAIVMLDTFPAGTLPGQDPLDEHTYTDTDIASFQELWLAADLIETCCLKPQHTPGWALAGGDPSRSLIR